METQNCPHLQEKIDPRVKRTRILLEDAIRSLLKEKPYSSISVSDIAERATLNRATFYAHFEDKRHLASTMMRSDLEHAIFTCLEPCTPMNADNLVRIGEAIFEFMGKILSSCPSQPDEFAPTLLSTLQETIQRSIQGWLEHDPDAMHLFPGVSMEAAATVVAWSLYGGAINWTAQHHRPPCNLVVRQIVTLLVRQHSNVHSPSLTHSVAKD